MKHFLISHCFISLQSNQITLPGFTGHQGNFLTLTWSSSLFPSPCGFGQCGCNSDSHTKKKKKCSMEIHLHRVDNEVPYTAFKRRNVSEWGRLEFRWSTAHEKLFDFDRLFCRQVLRMPSVFIHLNREDADKRFNINKYKKHITSNTIGNQTRSFYPNPSLH